MASASEGGKVVTYMCKVQTIRLRGEGEAGEEASYATVEDETSRQVVGDDCGQVAILQIGKDP